MSCAQIWFSDLNQISSESKQQPPLAQRTTRTLIIFSKRTGLFTRYFAKLCGIFFVTTQEINMQMLGVLADIRIHIKDKWCERQQMRQEKTELCKEDCDVYTSFYVSNPLHVYTVTIYYYYLESGSSRVFFLSSSRSHLWLVHWRTKHTVYPILWWCPLLNVLYKQNTNICKWHVC